MIGDATVFPPFTEPAGTLVLQLLYIYVMSCICIPRRCPIQTLNLANNSLFTAAPLEKELSLMPKAQLDFCTEETTAATL